MLRVYLQKNVFEEALLVPKVKLLFFFAQAGNQLILEEFAHGDWLLNRLEELLLLGCELSLGVA